ncbi:MAG: DNA repair protein RecO [Clostridia bacterium]|nr:DNA repair protein RecO [Clostridia bacterium]
MEEKYNAICIRSVLWRESDKLLTLFTLENGVVDCVVRGAMSPKSKWRFATEPFSFCEYVLTEKLGKKTLTEATQIDGFYDLRYDIEKLYCASAVLEFIRQSVFENASVYGLFLLTVNALKAIEKGAYPIHSLVRFFIGAVGELGYGATFSRCGVCKKSVDGRAFFDFESAAPVCENCADGSAIEMRAETLRLLSTLSDMDFDLLKTGDLSTYSEAFDQKPIVFHALRFMAYYLDVKLGCRLKSLSEVLETFDK